jgi:hypothetical protein
MCFFKTNNIQFGEGGFLLKGASAPFGDNPFLLDEDNGTFTNTAKWKKPRRATNVIVLFCHNFYKSFTLKSAALICCLPA